MDQRKIRTDWQRSMDKITKMTMSREYSEVERQQMDLSTYRF